MHLFPWTNTSVILLLFGGFGAQVALGQKGWDERCVDILEDHSKGLGVSNESADLRGLIESLRTPISLFEKYTEKRLLKDLKELQPLESHVLKFTRMKLRVAYTLLEAKIARMELTRESSTDQDFLHLKMVTDAMKHKVPKSVGDIVKRLNVNSTDLCYWNQLLTACLKAGILEPGDAKTNITQVLRFTQDLLSYPREDKLEQAIDFLLHIVPQENIIEFAVRRYTEALYDARLHLGTSVRSLLKSTKDLLKEPLFGSSKNPKIFPSLETKQLLWLGLNLRLYNALYLINTPSKMTLVGSMLDKARWVLSDVQYAIFRLKDSGRSMSESNLAKEISAIGATSLSVLNDFLGYSELNMNETMALVRLKTRFVELDMAMSESVKPSHEEIKPLFKDIVVSFLTSIKTLERVSSTGPARRNYIETVRKDASLTVQDAVLAYAIELVEDETNYRMWKEENLEPLKKKGANLELSLTTIVALSDLWRDLRWRQIQYALSELDDTFDDDAFNSAASFLQFGHVLWAETALRITDIYHQPILVALLAKEVVDKLVDSLSIEKDNEENIKTLMKCQKIFKELESIQFDRVGPSLVTAINALLLFVNNFVDADKRHHVVVGSAIPDELARNLSQIFESSGLSAQVTNRIEEGTCDSFDLDALTMELDIIEQWFETSIMEIKGSDARKTFLGVPVLVVLRYRYSFLCFMSFELRQGIAMAKEQGICSKTRVDAYRTEIERLRLSGKNDIEKTLGFNFKLSQSTTLELLRDFINVGTNITYTFLEQVDLALTSLPPNSSKYQELVKFNSEMRQICEKLTHLRNSKFSKSVIHDISSEFVRTYTTFVAAKRTLYSLLEA